jgi:hypothetical protein
MRVIPAPGLQVRDPATLQLVPAEGLDIDATDLTWARLLKDGDVVPAPAKPASGGKPSKEA